MGKTSESRIKRITQIARITPHIPTTALSFPSAMSFVHPAAIRRRDGHAQADGRRGEERTRQGRVKVRGERQDGRRPTLTARL